MSEVYVSAGKAPRPKGRCYFGSGKGERRAVMCERGESPAPLPTGRQAKGRCYVFRE